MCDDPVDSPKDHDERGPGDPSLSEEGDSGYDSQNNGCPPDNHVGAILPDSLLFGFGNDLIYILFGSFLRNARMLH